MCKVCTEAVHCVALWTRVTLGLDMCKVCTEAVHCVAPWTRVTLGLDMCKVCKKKASKAKNAFRTTADCGPCSNYIWVSFDFMFSNVGSFSVIFTAHHCEMCRKLQLSLKSGSEFKGLLNVEARSMTLPVPFKVPLIIWLTQWDKGRQWKIWNMKRKRKTDGHITGIKP